jgi:O-antigen ligase
MRPPQKINLDNTTLYLLLVACAFILSNGNISNAAFFILLIAGICSIQRRYFLLTDILIYFLFSLPIIAVFAGQMLRLEWSLKEFDAPSRIFAAIFIFKFVKFTKPSKKLCFNVLTIGSALGLILLLLFLDIDSTNFYRGRFATRTSAPNDLGGYSGLLLTMTVTGLLGLREKFKLIEICHKKSYKNIFIFLVCFAGLIAGAYILLGTQSRGPWLVAVFSLLITFLYWFFFQPKRAVKLLIFFALLFVTVLNTPWFKKLDDRIWSTVNEPIQWVMTNRENQEKTSGGARLSMLYASGELFSKAPFKGFGDFGYSPQAREPEFAQKYGSEVSHQLGGQGGPHNEIAARSLQSGIWGLIATVFLLVYPVYRFGRQTLQADDEDQRDLSFMGFVIFSYIFLLSFVLEPYSLKHTATFNALLLAVLLGATRIDSTAIAAPEKSNA